MKKFEFSTTTKPPVPTFTGYAFYNVYKEAEFLRNSENIETILSKGYQLRHSLKAVSPGDTMMVSGMNLEKNTPLLVKKTGPGVIVEDYEFTQNRLTGLVAAYAFDNHHRFPAIISSEAASLGLGWDNSVQTKCKLYLSAVSGTEHFYDQFSFWPLVCALRKLQLKKITPEIVIKMAKIKNNNGVRLAQDLMKNRQIAKKLWQVFPGTRPNDFDTLMTIATPEIRRLFIE